MRLWPPITAALAASIVLTGCVEDSYQPRVICHNANCQEPADPENDSLMWTLERSLELSDGESHRPPYDGIELDTFWWGDEDRCLMAHDLDNPEEGVDALDSVERVNQALADRIDEGQPLTRHHDEFTLLIELKGFVSDSKADAHDDRQRRLHAECVVEMAQSKIDAADDEGYDVEVIFMAFDPRLLVEIVESPDYQDLTSSPHRIRLSALRGLPRPLDVQTVPLNEYPDDIGIDMVSTHPNWTSRVDRQGFASRDWALSYWSFNLTPEVLDAVDGHRPEYVTTSHAPSFAGWLQRR